MYSNQSGRGNDPTGTSSYCCFIVNFSRLLYSNAIHVFFDGSLGPKVVQIIATSNKKCAFFVVFHVFGLLPAVRAAACGGPLDERMRIAGLRCREAAARTTLTSRRRNACFMKNNSSSCHRAFRRGLASQTGGCRKRFHSFFFLEKNVE